jgi:hypothetical protein
MCSNIACISICVPVHLLIQARSAGSGCPMDAVNHFQKHKRPQYGSSIQSILEIRVKVLAWVLSTIIAVSKMLKISGQQQHQVVP